MNILLINPNRFMSPPVPPLGLEYLAGALEKEGHGTKILDLCFSDNIYNDIDEAVKSFTPDIAGISVRNVDSVLFDDNEFYLDEIRDIVRFIKSSCGIKVLVGGAGLMTNPEGVLEYLDADYAFVGPAEDDIPGFMKMILKQVPVERIYYGKARSDYSCKRVSSAVDYAKYYQNSGLAGFETHKGCSSSCVYCIEANSRVSFRNPGDVLREIRGFVDAGYNHFHLCDSEFNEDLDFSLDICSALKQSGMNIQWTVYMKPTNFNSKLFRLMKATGVYLITLTVDSFKKCSMYWSDIEKFVFHAKSNGIFLAIDFLTGFPYEDEKVLTDCLDLFRRVQPDRVTINTYIRLYEPLQITKIIMKDGALSPYLLGASGDRSMIKPVFYNHVDTQRLKELIEGDAFFRIAGEDKGVNYSTLQGKSS
ncbi:MAG: cobalamin-dependent protein [Nitrospirota bacterium]|nr:cobalamin-dependent protein [Nitrospirota bacterium]